MTTLTTHVPQADGVDPASAVAAVEAVLKIIGRRNEPCARADVSSVWKCAAEWHWHVERLWGG